MIMKRFFYAICAVLILSSCGSSYIANKHTGDEEIIDLGYTKEVKSRTATSSSHIDVTDVAISGYSNIYEYLQGRVSGVSIEGDASSGNCTVIIRGVKSINFSSEPLFLVDGHEVSSLSGISPAVVESVEVLKDPSACAIYGSRGANGVILIRTKSVK